MGYRRTRISAFIIDAVFVAILTFLIANVSFLNPGLEAGSIASAKYDEVAVELFENIDNTNEEEIEVLMNKVKDVTYDYEKSNTYFYLYYLIFSFLYFVIFQWWNNGQTLGKKIFKLKVVNENDENPNFIQYFIRTLCNGSSLLMGVNLFVLIKIIILFIGVSKGMFYNVFSILQNVSLIYEVLFIIVLVANKNNKALNDVIARTKVVSTRK